MLTVVPLLVVVVFAVYQILHGDLFILLGNVLVGHIGFDDGTLIS